MAPARAARHEAPSVTVPLLRPPSQTRHWPPPAGAAARRPPAEGCGPLASEWRGAGRPDGGGGGGGGAGRARGAASAALKAAAPPLETGRPDQTGSRKAGGTHRPTATTFAWLSGR